MSVVIGESRSIRRKPAPDTVLEALKELGSNPWESVYVGDSEVDIKNSRGGGYGLHLGTWGL